MTQDRGFTPHMRWVGLVLAALPGLWLAWQGPAAVGSSPRPLPAAVLAIGAACVLQGYVRRGLGNPYGPFIRLTDGLVVMALWLPVLVATALYHKRGGPAPVPLAGTGLTAPG